MDLECDHCGGVACTPNRNGYFTEDMSDRCETCGFPGQVIVDDVDDGDEVAHWLSSDGPNVRCRRPSCEDGCVDDA